MVSRKVARKKVAREVFVIIAQGKVQRPMAQAVAKVSILALALSDWQTKRQKHLLRKEKHG